MARGQAPRNQGHGWKLTVTVTAYTTDALLTALRRVIQDRKHAEGYPVKTKATGRRNSDGCAAWSAESELSSPFIEADTTGPEASDSGCSWGVWVFVPACRLEPSGRILEAYWHEECASRDKDAAEKMRDLIAKDRPALWLSVSQTAPTTMPDHNVYDGFGKVVIERAG